MFSKAFQEDFRSTGRVELLGRAWHVGHPQTSLGLGELLARGGLGSAAWRFERKKSAFNLYTHKSIHTYIYMYLHMNIHLFSYVI